MRNFKFRKWNKTIKEMEYFDWLPSDRDNEKWMQFTGLHDKQGKEIYEGDVIWGGKFNESTGKKHLAVVKPQKIDRHYALNGWGGWEIEYIKCDKYSFIYSWEVIGNIYENGELL